MTTPQVSIIIPFYSNLDWLCEAVESVLSQTYQDYEIIVVNDGSPDDMTEFLNTYGKRLLCISQPNNGPAAARNNGIRHARGRYIAFIDSDDVWLPTKLEKQVDFMKKTGAMWCHTGYWHWYPATGRLKQIFNRHDYDDILLQRIVSSKVATPAVIFDRRIFDEESFRYPEDMRIGEDDQLYTEIAVRHKIGLIAEPLVKVRQRGDNTYTRVIERFHLRRNNFRKWKAGGRKFPMMIHFIFALYSVYSRIFPLSFAKKPWAIFSAKCCWVLPYAIERAYLRVLYMTLRKDPRYLVD